MGYGGALIWTAVIKNVKNQFPNKPIIFIYSHPFKAFLKGIKNADVTIYKNNPDIHKLIPSWRWAFLKFFFSKKYYVLNTNEGTIPFIEKDTPEKIFYKKGRNMVDYINESLNINTSTYTPAIFLTEQEVNKAQNVLSKHNIKHFICIEPNSKDSFTPNKAWFWENWQELVNRILAFAEKEGIPLQIVQLSAPNMPVLENVITFSNQGLSFRECAHILKKSYFFVTYMGGLQHLHKAVGGKNINVISSFEPKELGTYTDDINFYTDIECGNCGLKTPCPINRKCMASISVDTVFDAVKTELLQITK